MYSNIENTDDDVFASAMEDAEIIDNPFVQGGTDGEPLDASDAANRLLDNYDNETPLPTQIPQEVVDVLIQFGNVYDNTSSVDIHYDERVILRSGCTVSKINAIIYNLLRVLLIDFQDIKN